MKKVLVLFLLTYSLTMIGGLIRIWWFFLVMGELSKILGWLLVVLLLVAIFRFTIALFHRLFFGSKPPIQPMRNNSVPRPAETVVIENDDYIGVLTKIKKQKEPDLDDYPFEEEEKKHPTSGEMWQGAWRKEEELLL